MKKLLTFVLFAILAINSYAQDKPAVAVEKNVLKVNTLSLIFGTGSVFYEHKLSDNISGQLGLCYLNYKLGDTKLSGLIITPELRIYPRKNAIDGFYVAPYLRYQRYSAGVTNSTPETKAVVNIIGGGFLLGRQWIRPSGFTMDLFFGPSYGNVSVNDKTGDESINTSILSGVGMRIGFALGFAF